MKQNRPERGQIANSLSALLFFMLFAEVIQMDSVYRDAFPDIFATCDYDPEELKIDVSMLRLEDEPNVEVPKQ